MAKYTKNADGTVTSTFNVDAPNPTTQAPIQPQQGTTYSQNADGTVTSTFNTPVQPAQPVEKPQQTGTTYKQNADGTVTSTFNQPTQTVQNQNQITDWKNLTDDQKTLDNLSKLVNNRYNTQSTINGQNVNATIGDGTYSWYLDEGKNPIKTQTGTVQKQGEVQPNMAPTGLVFDRTSDWSALRPQDKTINNLQKLIEARYGTLAEVEGDRVVADIGGKMYQWTLDQNGNPVKTEVPADNTQFNSGEILEQLKANPSLDLSSYDPVEASIAKSNYDKIQNFSDMTQQQLSESYNAGDLIPGTAVRNDLVKNNPNMKSFLEMCSILNLINGVTINPLMMEKKVEENATKNKGMIATALEDGEFSQKEIDEITMSDDLKQQKKELDEQGKKVARLQSEYHTLELDIEDELKGQNATASYRDRLLAREGKNLYRELDLAQRTYQTMLGAYNDSYERSMTLFNLNLQLYKEAKAQAREDKQRMEERQWDIANQNRQMLMNYWNTLEERQYNEDLMQKQREWNKEDAIWQMETQMKYDMGDLKSDNPYLVQQAIRRISQGIYDAYSSLIPGLESPEMMEQRINQYIADGMTPTEAVQTVHDEKKNSNRMQSALQNYQNQLNYDNWQMKTEMTPTISYGTYGNVSGTGLNSSVVYDFISQCRETGSCGQGVNDYLEQLGEGRIFGSSYEDKYKNVNSDTPIEGAIAVRNPGKHQYGHVGIVTGVDGDYVTITDWNFNNDNKQDTRKVPISSILADGKGGFYIPQALQNNGGQQGNYIDDHAELYDRYLTGKMTDADKKLVTEMYGSFPNFISSSKRWQEAQVDQNLVDLYEKAINLKEFMQGAGLGKTGRVLSQNNIVRYFDDKGAAFDSYFRNLVDSTALQNLIKLKGDGATFGALSDQELRYITNSSTDLKRDLSDKDFMDRLDKMIGSIEKQLGYSNTNTSNINNTQKTTTSTSGKTKTKSGGTINW